jgi:hypothetical protein
MGSFHFRLAQFEISATYSLDGLFLLWHIWVVAWDIEFTDEFGVWWDSLSEEEQVSVAASVELLKEKGPNLRFPHSSGIAMSKHDHMRELRTQHRGRPYRTLYAFDLARVAILLIGGDKTGDDRWYEVNVPIADRLYDEHIAAHKKGGI